MRPILPAVVQMWPLKSSDLSYQEFIYPSFRGVHPRPHKLDSKHHLENPCTECAQRRWNEEAFLKRNHNSYH